MELIQNSKLQGKNTKKPWAPICILITLYLWGTTSVFNHIKLFLITNSIKCWKLFCSPLKRSQVFKELV